MNRKIYEIKKGIKLHCIKTELFKTDLSSIFITYPLTKENATLNSLMTLVLRRGCKKYPNQYEFNKELDNLYGANFVTGLDKSHDNISFKICMETISNEYALDGENILKNSLYDLFEIILNPLLIDGKFNEDFLELEKTNLKNIIEGKIDDKDTYALDSCLEKMYGRNGIGIYKYGFVEDIEKITIDDITNYYYKLINEAKIDIFVSSNNDAEFIKNLVFENENIKKLNEREPNFIRASTECSKGVDKVRYFEEKADVVQGKLVMGYDLLKKNENTRYIGSVYNAILGNGANSMLFQNVREKESLAYSAKSEYYNIKGAMFIRCGILIENYQKAIDIINVQIDNIKNGNFDDEILNNAKIFICSVLRKIEEEQYSELLYYYGEELTGITISMEEYINKINNVSKEDVVNFANDLKLNTVYFLRD